ncbi:MAG: 3-hydroxyacyl-CoA dehydrogenase NAD-binding domain-containing protein [Planctomycetota bacterium]
MIDLSKFPSPKDAPEPGACLRIERPEEGLAVVVIDPPHRSFPVLDAPMLRDLDAAFTELEGDASLKGIVITGRRPDRFLAGADIDAIAEITDAGVVRHAVMQVHDLFARLSRMKPTTVAAVGGPVPGGAYEISLACDAIVATDARSTRIGLPETQLGIIPGWGGSHRLPWRIGIPGALDAILTGRLFPAKKALKMGMVDRLTKEEYLLRVASDIAMGRQRVKRRSRGWKRWFVDRNPLAKFVIASQARKQVDSRAHGNYPAPYRALDVVLAAPGKVVGEAALAEADATAELATGAVAKNLVSIFFGSEAAKKLGTFEDGSSPDPMTSGTVIGGGVMGGGIASLMAEKGMDVRLADLSQGALDAAVIQHRKDVEKKRKRRRIEPHRANAAIDRLSVSLGISAVSDADIAIEAVAEILDVKRKVFSELEREMSPEAILATNTSSLSVSAIQQSAEHPERIVGMHFFNPVKKMPLVEIVRGARTSDETITRTAALAIRLGKTPVVTKDVPGFLVNRLLGPYLDEAVRLFEGGVSPIRIDRLLVQFGMPMGPFELLDEVGLDIASHAAKSLHEGYGDRMTPTGAIDGMVAPERRGKKTGKGFYDHRAKRKKGSSPPPMDDLSRFQSHTRAMSLDDETLVERIVLAMLGEGARAMEERVVETPTEFDLATVFGTGFAPFRGGLLKYADAVGAQEIVSRMDAHRAMPDVAARGAAAARFEPAAILRLQAETGGSFHGTADRPSEAVAAS